MPGQRFAREEDRPLPGSIDVRRPPESETNAAGPIVINCFAQWELGTPLKYRRVRPPLGMCDSRQQREQWFASCLRAIGELHPIPTPLAFPKEIGCGMAGGIWRNYESMIEAFAKEHPECEVIIVRWTGASAAPKRSKKKALR